MLPSNKVHQAIQNSVANSVVILALNGFMIKHNILVKVKTACRTDLFSTSNWTHMYRQ